MLRKKGISKRIMLIFSIPIGVVLFIGAIFGLIYLIELILTSPFLLYFIGGIPTLIVLWSAYLFVRWGTTKPDEIKAIKKELIQLKAEKERISGSISITNNGGELSEAKK